MFTLEQSSPNSAHELTPLHKSCQGGFDARPFLVIVLALHKKGRSMAAPPQIF